MRGAIGDYEQERTRPRRRPGRAGDLGSMGLSPLPVSYTHLTLPTSDLV